MIDESRLEPPAPPRPRACGTALFVTLVCAAIGLMLSACGGGRIAALRDAKSCHDRGDFECVAAVDVTCSPDQDGCNQLHLLKGDACFRLTSSTPDDDDAVIARYRCAAEHLAAGIEQTEDWRPMGDPLTWRTNLLEALRGWQDRESGELALNLSNRLLAAAQEVQSEHPGHPAPIYFEIGARYALMQPDLVAGDHPDVLCDSLATLTRRLDSASASAQGTPYEANFTQLTSDLRAAVSLIPGCP